MIREQEDIQEEVRLCWDLKDDWELTNQGKE